MMDSLVLLSTLIDQLNHWSEYKSIPENGNFKWSVKNEIQQTKTGDVVLQRRGIVANIDQYCIYERISCQLNSMN